MCGTKLFLLQPDAREIRLPGEKRPFRDAGPGACWWANLLAGTVWQWQPWGSLWATEPVGVVCLVWAVGPEDAQCGLF